MKNLMNWLYLHWAKATPFLAIYSYILLFLYVKDVDFALFLIWLQTPIYWTHETEEYLVPGGFLQFFNHSVFKSPKGEWPLTLAGSFWINIPLVYIALPIAGLMAHFLGVEWGLWAAYFSALNALAHVVMAIIFKKYNPGLVISILLNIPVGIYTVWYFVSNGLCSTTCNVISIIVGVLAQASMMIYGFGFLKPMMKRELGQ